MRVGMATRAETAAVLGAIVMIRARVQEGTIGIVRAYIVPITL